MEMKPKEQMVLAQQYQKQLDNLNNHEFFEDATRCDVCGDYNVVFEQRQNGISRKCIGTCKSYQENLEAGN